MKKIISWILALAMCLSFTACGQNGASSSGTAASSSQASASGSGSSGTAAKDVTLKVFSNCTNRTTGQGLIEQTLLDMYTAEHPNVHIEVETLDDENFKTKFKAYVTAKTVPDLFTIWMTPTYLDSLIQGGVLAALDSNRVSSLKFETGSLDYATADSKIYALPRNTDTMVFYYNKALFQQYNVSVPKTYEELLAAADVFSKAGIVPVSMCGGAGWANSHFITAIMGQVLGEKTGSTLLDNCKTGKYSGDYWTKTCNLASEAAKHLFCNGFETYDNATAKNLFLNGGAAMWWMGSWEMSMTPSFEVGAFSMPSVDPSVKGALFAFSGGGYAVSANSGNKDVAADLLYYMLEPEHWSKLCWKNGVCMSAQNFYDYVTGSESSLQKDILNIMNQATSRTGLNFRSYDAQLTSAGDASSLALLAGLCTAEDFEKNMEKAAAARS